MIRDFDRKKKKGNIIMVKNEFGRMLIAKKYAEYWDDGTSKDKPEPQSTKEAIVKKDEPETKAPDRPIDPQEDEPDPELEKKDKGPLLGRIF